MMVADQKCYLVSNLSALCKPQNGILKPMQRLVSLKLTHRVFRDIDKVDDLMQDITEQRELAQEISDAISKPVGFGEEFDDVGADCFFFLEIVCFLWIQSCSSAKLLYDFFLLVFVFPHKSDKHPESFWWRLCSSTLAIVSTKRSRVSKLFVKFLMK